MFLVVGIVLLVLVVLALAFNLWESFTTHGGEIGQVPVLGSAAIQVPLLLVTGMVFLGRAMPALAFPWWYYLLLWIASVLVFGWLTIKIGELGKKRRPHGG